MQVYGCDIQMFRDEPISSHPLDAQGIERMRASCELAADVLAYAGTLVKVGHSSLFL